MTATTQRPAPPRWTGERRGAIGVVLLVAMVWSISGLDVTLDRLLGAPSDAWAILRQMIPPAFARVAARGAVGKVFESVYIAWIGTVIGAVLSLPLAFMAAHNVAPIWIRVPIRQLFNAIRAVPELILAVILIPITGLGPWAGTLAIGIHSIGTLGKWATESIESIDSGPIEAVESTGGRWVSSMRWAVFPQVMSTISSYWLFRFEINVRASAVLGMIGAGGVGSELVSHLVFRDFPAASAVLVLTVGVVLTIDTISASVRRRIITGSVGSDDSSRSSEALADLTGIKHK
ncbi:MAG: phosphonate ABC transporter, permease protein PhnE [Actinobacteria bacterium]|nr:phosphonate ABC transporter, permease protein PhnE [Actinomycetota bacterium]MDP7550955.1 phosphonate ABC transporter, permease protein PhnE [Acidimicrobiales bacterium]MBT3687065.1 phosphonate ABC transporter, permease protein PhnE [Actinomycetota bacterium]MBT4037494.1 phosphonate ABC transporter, permease protein PhnE [Actinomycetota bacterium]MBT4279794.1 phosphonate ABC transporter, permease protein PhnE [Actinomycetota bacterium]